MTPYFFRRAMPTLVLVCFLAVSRVYSKPNDPQVSTPLFVEDACPPCEVLFSKLERTGRDGKLAQDVTVQERGEPKSGTGVMYFWASAALIHACDYLQELFGQGSCLVKDGHSEQNVTDPRGHHAIQFEPALGGSDARCSCETVDRVSIAVFEAGKHLLPVKGSCAFQHSGGIAFKNGEANETTLEPPCTFADGSHVVNHDELWLCMHEASCDITDDRLQMAVFRDPRPTIVSTYFYLQAVKHLELGDLDAFVRSQLPITCQWLAARYVIFAGILADQSIEVWYNDAMVDPLGWHYHWLNSVGLQLPFHVVEATAQAAAADNIDFNHKKIDRHPGEAPRTDEGIRRFENEVSPETVEFADAILRTWLPAVLLERFGVVP